MRKSSKYFKEIWRFVDGILGTWNTTPVDLKLNDDVKPVCSQPYPVQRLHEEILEGKSKDKYK